MLTSTSYDAEYDQNGATLEKVYTTGRLGDKVLLAAH